MTDETPAHGCTVNGQPAMPILISEYQQLTADLATLRAVARGYCPACGRGDAAPTTADWEQQKQRADQAEELLRIAHETSNQSEAERARAVQRAEQLAATLHDVLSHFTHKGHPGEPCLQTGWISEKTVAHWRTVLYQPAPAPAATPAADKPA